MLTIERVAYEGQRAEFLRTNTWFVIDHKRARIIAQFEDYDHARLFIATLQSPREGNT